MKRMVAFIILLTFVIALLTACSDGSQGIGEAGISAEEFSQLMTGMTQGKVNSIIGGDGDLISESKNEDDNYLYFKRVYHYDGEISGYAELEFTQKVAKGIQQLSPYDDSLSVRLSSKTKYELQ